MDNFKRKELEVRRKKAEASIAELEFKILEREQDIQRIRDHIKLQEQVLLDVEKELKE